MIIFLNGQHKSKINDYAQDQQLMEENRKSKSPKLLFAQLPTFLPHITVRIHVSHSKTPENPVWLLMELYNSPTLLCWMNPVLLIHNTTELQLSSSVMVKNRICFGSTVKHFSMKILLILTLSSPVHTTKKKKKKLRMFSQ